ncbi:MAG: hypothetical protein IJ129_00450 [Ruminococcus sp.]|nr:hypothetical protein [Ruminococcus sp.]
MLNKPKGMGRAVMIFLLLGIVLPVAMYFAILKGSSVEDEYVKNGTLVDCRVCRVEGTGKHQYVEVTYKDEKGTWITAEAVANKRVSLDEKFKAYVLPEDPMKVYRPADAGMKYILYCMVIFFTFAGWIALIVQIAAMKNYKLLKKSGVAVKAQLVSLGEYKDNRFGKFRFLTPSGREFTKEFGISHGYPIVGEYYDVLCCEKKNGKCAAELIDMQLI